MNSSERFYRHCYQATDGWVPMMPLGSEIRLGDFGQIVDSEFLPLGNIFKLRSLPINLPEGPTIKTRTDIGLNVHDWQMSDGIEEETSLERQASSEHREDDDSFALLQSRAVWFADAGSFSFSCSAPRAEFIVNWNQISQIIMLGLTLIEHSFREVYIVTRLASVDNWELAVAKTANAELKVSSRVRDENHYNVTYDAAGVHRQSKGLDFYHIGVDRPAHFFQAKKLIMSDVKRDHYISKILDQKDELPPNIIANLLKTDLLNQVKENELNQPHFLKCEGKENKQQPFCEINVAPYFEFFEWADLSLDDIAKLC
ncbi:MAG: hypothetical protein ACI9XU_000228 [Arenicella sp.]|jgi:hypothetical protein